MTPDYTLGEALTAISEGIDLFEKDTGLDAVYLFLNGETYEFLKPAIHKNMLHGLKVKTDNIQTGGGLILPLEFFSIEK